jgi:tetratricopeptide (TPR) repeat protein
MKKIIFLLIIFPGIHHIYAQSTVRDSLSQLLQKEKSDTSRVLLLVQLSYQYAFSKPDSAMLLALKGLELSRRIGFPKGEAASLNRIGSNYNLLGNYLKAMQLHLQALQISEKINDVDGIAGILNDIGNVLRSQGEYYKAIEYHLKAKKLSEQLNNKEGLVSNLGNLSRCYLRLKKYDSAIANARQAYEIASKFNYHRRTGNYFY